ncbi:hypothetical protein N8D56_25750 (plasmid) [Devosia sp. A8/3-2]|nr:hypothetical protein N8D56_25750 [Devosia sp. A8/3-2]
MLVLVVHTGQQDVPVLEFAVETLVDIAPDKHWICEGVYPVIPESYEEFSDQRYGDLAEEIATRNPG